MAIKLIMSDIDGTILPYGNKVVSERTRAAFRAAADAGIMVGPASGRFYGMVPRFFSGDARCCQTAVASNGLQVCCGGEVVLQKTMTREELDSVCRVLDDVPGSGLIFYVGDGIFVAHGTREDLAECFPAYAPIARPATEAPAGAPALKANAFVNGSLEDTRALCERLDREVDGLDFDVPQPQFLNIMPAGWNKGTALSWLMERFGIARNEAVVFGDGGNDIPLFGAVEHSVAVAGALPEAAEAARWHIGACEDDAVAAAIEAIIASK